MRKGRLRASDPGPSGAPGTRRHWGTSRDGHHCARRRLRRVRGSRSQTPSCRNLDPNPPVAHFPLPLERISEVPRTACLHGRDASSVWPPPERSDEVQASMLLLSPSGFREPCLLLAGAGLTEHVQPWPGGLKVLTSQGGS
ncbi:putative UPF0633 protein [Macaca mulatta]